MKELSPQEVTIMQIVWNAEDDFMTAREIESAMHSLDGKERNISSLMTVLGKLADKGYLNPVKVFRKPTRYIPLIAEAEYKAFATEKFMDKVHNGEFSSFLSALVERKGYTKQEISEMREMLEGWWGKDAVNND